MNDPIRHLKMEDIGTRLEHLMQLQDLWGRGLAIATQGYQTDLDKLLAKELQIALDLLTNHMQKDFISADYAKTINSLPKDANEIKDSPADPPPTSWRDTV